MKKTQILFLTAAVMLLTGVTLAVPTPIIELGFANDDLTNTGSLASDGWMTDSSTPVFVPGVAADLGNDPTARAMNNTLVNPADTIGLMVGNNTAGTPGDVANAMNGADSFTVCGWFYNPGSFPTLGSNATSWDRRENSAYYHYNLRSFTDGFGRPRSYVNNTLANHPPFQYWNYVDSWFFAAMTYDSASGTLVQYRANNSFSGVIGVSYSLSAGPLNNSDYGIMFGDRDWYAYMDNLRVYVSADDSTGALTEAQLNEVFAADKLSEVPEPATVALLAVGAGLLWKRRGN